MVRRCGRLLSVVALLAGLALGTTGAVGAARRASPATANVPAEAGRGTCVTPATRTTPAYAASLFDQTGTPNLGDGGRSAAITADRFVSALVMVSDNAGGQLGSYRAMRGGDSS